MFTIKQTIDKETIIFNRKSVRIARPGSELYSEVMKGVDEDNYPGGLPIALFCDDELAAEEGLERMVVFFHDGDTAYVTDQYGNTVEVII